MPPKKAGEKELVISYLKSKLVAYVLIGSFLACAAHGPANQRCYLASRTGTWKQLCNKHFCRHQEQSADLQVQNYKLAEELEDQKSKLKDINDFLVNELKARALSYAALQAELAETKKKMAEEKAAFTVLCLLWCRSYIVQQ